MQYEELNQDGIGVGLLHPEFVPVVFATSREIAERFRFALEQHGIPAIIEDNAVGNELCSALGRGIPILVPNHMHDSASAIIAGEEQGEEQGMGVFESVDNDDDLLDDEDDDEEEEEEEEEDDEFDEDLDDLDDLDDDLDEEDDDLGPELDDVD